MSCGQAWGLYSTWSLSRVSDGNDVDRLLVRQMTVLSQGNDQYFRFVTRLSRAMEVKAAGGTPDLASNYVMFFQNASCRAHPPPSSLQ